MPGQWEFQVGPVAAPEVADQLWVARWLLYRTGEDFPTAVRQRRVGHARPEAGQGRLERRWLPHQLLDRRDARELRRVHRRGRGARHRGTRCTSPTTAYGIEERLTGQHETASYDEFFYGVSHRGASVRIPWQVAQDKKGYIEDRRPNANMDPYVVTRLIVETVCGTADGDLPKTAPLPPTASSRPPPRAY